MGNALTSIARPKSIHIAALPRERARESVTASLA